MCSEGLSAPHKATCCVTCNRNNEAVAWGQRRFDLNPRPSDLVPSVTLGHWRGWSFATIVGRRPGIAGREPRSAHHLRPGLAFFSMQVGTCEARRRTQRPTVCAFFARGGFPVACTTGLQRLLAREWRHPARRPPTGDRPRRRFGQPHACLPRSASTADESGKDIGTGFVGKGDPPTMLTAREGKGKYASSGGRHYGTDLIGFRFR